MALSTPLLALTTMSFCAAVALLIGAYKAHEVLKNSTSATFLTAFSLIATGLLVRLIVDTQTNLSILTLDLMQGLLGIGFSNKLLLILSSLLLLSAYTLLLLVAERIQNTAMRIIAALFILLTITVSTQIYLIVHLVTAILLALLAYRFYTNFLAKNSTNALIVYLAFLALLIAHIAALFTAISTTAHYLFLTFRLIGYFALFVMLWRVRQ